MSVKLGTTIYIDFHTVHPVTGIVINADSLPTYNVFKNDGTTPLTITGGSIAQRTGYVGNYVIALPCTPGNGFTSADTFAVQGSATVAGVSNTETLTNFLITNYLADEIVQGNDNKVLLSNNAHAGATIPTVTTLTNAPSDSPGVTTLLSRASEVRLAELDAANLPTDIAAVKSDTAATLTDTAEIGAAGAGLTALATQASVNTIDDFLDTEITAIINDIAALNNLSAAQINAEVVDALTTDTYPEVTAVPAATSSLIDKINWVCALARNKILQTATTQTLRNDADTADIATSTHSDDGTTHTKGEWV